MKAYLGDGVYAMIGTAGHLVLTTENGLEATNTIFIEPDVWSALCSFVAQKWKGVVEETHEA